MTHRIAVLPLLLMVLAVLAGCSAKGTGAGGGRETLDAARYGVKFTRIAPRGYVDMSLEFANPGTVPVTLQGRLVPRDGEGGVVPDAEVSTAFGTERGRAVVMPGGSVDFAQVRGPGAVQVRDISLEQASVSAADVPVAREFVDLVPLDGRGRELTYDATARHARLDNPNDVPVPIRIVLMVLRAPEEGVPQQASLVHDVTTVVARPNGETIVDLDPTTRHILITRGADSFVTLRPVVAPQTDPAA